MKFSVIVGIYNQKDTLPLLLASLMQQSFKDFEVHLCDDGSDDGTEVICQEVAEKFSTHFTYHRQGHKGMRLARNLNQGINAAKGEHCLFVMGDSFLERDYLDILNSWVHPHRIICGIRIQVDNGVGVDIDWRVKKENVPDHPAIIINQPYSCLTGNGLTVPTEALRELGGWNEQLEGYGGDDTELIGRLFFSGYIPWSVPELLLYHHWHKSSESNSKNIHLAKKLIEAYAL